jgi:hypothetical protein
MKVLRQDSVEKDMGLRITYCAFNLTLEMQGRIFLEKTQEAMHDL